MLSLLQAPSPASSAHLREDEPPPLGTPNAMLHSSDPIPTASPRDAPPEENVNAPTSHLREDEPPPLGTSNAIPHSSDPIPTASPRGTPPQENLKTAKSYQGISILKSLLPKRKSNKNPALHGPDRVPRKSRRAADRQSRSHSPARAEDSDAGPSRMAATKRVPVSVL